MNWVPASCAFSAFLYPPEPELQDMVARMQKLAINFFIINKNKYT
jgi:hypothetical protein